MPHSISITSLANDAAMPTTVSGTINVVTGDPGDSAAEVGGDPPPGPTPVPGPAPVVQVMICIYDQSNNQVGQGVSAQVTGSTWTCSNIPSMSNGTYKLYAILNYDQEPATSDSRTGLHKP